MVVHHQAAASLGDHAGALEHRQKAARRLAGRSRQLGEVGLSGRDQHVPLLAVGKLLRDELAKHHRHPALHGLEGLGGEPLVGRSQPIGQRDHELRRQLGVLLEQPAHVGSQHGDGLHAIAGLHRGRAALVVEHGQLAKDVPGAKRGERDRAPVGVCAEGACVAGAHDVARVALVALAEDHLAGLEAARDGDLRDLLEILARQRLEYRDPGEELDRLVGTRRHGRERIRHAMCRARSPAGVRAPSISNLVV